MYNTSTVVASTPSKFTTLVDLNPTVYSSFFKFTLFKRAFVHEGHLTFVRLFNDNDIGSAHALSDVRLREALSAAIFRGDPVLPLVYNFYIKITTVR